MLPFDPKVAEMLAELICEYQIPGIAPHNVGNLFFMRLLLIHLLQHYHDGVGQGDDPASAVLRRDERISSLPRDRKGNR